MHRRVHVWVLYYGVYKHGLSTTKYNIENTANEADKALFYKNTI